MNLSVIDKKKLVRFIAYGIIAGLCLYTALLLFRACAAYAKGPGIDTVHLNKHAALHESVGHVRIFFLGTNKVKYRAFVHKLEAYLGDGCRDPAEYYQLCETIRTHDPMIAHNAVAPERKRSFVQKLLIQTTVSKSWSAKQDTLLSVLHNTFNASTPDT